MNRVCKQCGRSLPIESYRRYAARGKGVYKTEQGSHTVCKECENINSRALALEKNPEQDRELYDKLVVYYRTLEEKGLGIASAVAGRYLGKDKSVAAARPASTIDKIDAVLQQLGILPEVDVFMTKLRKREFISSTEAWTHYDALKTQLQDAGLRDDAARLIEDWEIEEEGA